MKGNESLMGLKNEIGIRNLIGNGMGSVIGNEIWGDSE